MICENSDLAAVGAAERQQRFRRGLSGSRVTTMLWLLLALLAVHWAVPLGSYAETPVSLGSTTAAGDDFSPGERSGEPALQPRPPTLIASAEVRPFAGAHEDRASNAPPVDIPAAILLDRAQRFSTKPAASVFAWPITVRHAYDARGPPRIG